MPALKPPPRHPSALVPHGDLCPRCGSMALNRATLICICGAEFTAAGLDHWRAMPRDQALRRN